jgi:hypothetical protein
VKETKRDVCGCLACISSFPHSDRDTVRVLSIPVPPNKDVWDGRPKTWVFFRKAWSTEFDFFPRITAALNTCLFIYSISGRSSCAWVCFTTILSTMDRQETRFSPHQDPCRPGVHQIKTRMIFFPNRSKLCVSVEAHKERKDRTARRHVSFSLGLMGAPLSRFFIT